MAGTTDQPIYAKRLEDGSRAVGLFNLGETVATVKVAWSELKLTGPQNVRDLWRQKNLGVKENSHEVILPPHGAELL